MFYCVRKTDRHNAKETLKGTSRTLKTYYKVGLFSHAELSGYPRVEVFSFNTQKR